MPSECLLTHPLFRPSERLQINEKTLLVDNKITFCTHLAQLGLPAFPPHFGQTCHHSRVLMKKLFDYETYKKAHIFGPEIGMQ